MANLKKILHNFYYNPTVVLNEDGDKECRYVIKEDLQSLIDAFIQTRDAEAYGAALQTRFNLYLSTLPSDDEDWAITPEEQCILDQCVTQRPIILAKDHTEKDFFFAVITAQLPQFLAHSEFNQAFFSPYIRQMDSGELFIFPAPFTNTHKRASEDYLKSTHTLEDEDWERLRQMQLNKSSAAIECLQSLIDQCEVDFRGWLASINGFFKWSADITPNIFFSELWAMFTYFLVPVERTDAFFSIHNKFMTGIIHLPNAILNYDFRESNGVFPPLQNMLTSCCQHMKRSLANIETATSLSKGDAVTQDSTSDSSESEQDSTVLRQKQTTRWMDFFCCCCFKKETSMEEPLVQAVQNV